MIYFLHISYDGTAYRGWQRQLNAISVQEVIELKLKKIFKKEITVIGCGRTDAGVHASQYLLHIYLDTQPQFDLVFRLNKHLPNDIVAYNMIPMDESSHARFDAHSRTYDYFIHSYHDPILYRYSTYHNFENYNFEAMKSAASILCNYSDFKAVCKQPEMHNHTKCQIKKSVLYIDHTNQRMQFSITANRFLRGMIRLIVSYLLKIGAGEITLEAFEILLANKINIPENKPAQPNGLFLTKIEYPYLSLDTRPDICSMLKKGLEH